MSIPYPPHPDDEPLAPWPHCDQSPLKPELAAIQGLLNILPNGPDDGGLAVMTNSVGLFADLWKEFANEFVSPGNSKSGTQLTSSPTGTTRTTTSVCSRTTSPGSSRKAARPRSPA